MHEFIRGLHGVIFDLDGTLVDSRLDFDAIRRDLELPPGELILEALAQIPPGARKVACLAKLREHELRGADCAALMPGAAELLASLHARGVRTAVLTRNSRESTERTLGRLGLSFSLVLTREDAPPKPDPEGLLAICAHWETAVERVVFVGDYVFDLECGRNAGIRTILYAPEPELPAFADQADHVIRHFDEISAVLAG